MRALAWLILFTWLLALGRTILNLLLVPRLRPRMPERTPLVSVIVPARNEERAVERTVRALLAQTYPALEVIVIDDRSTDATGEILARVAQEDSRLTILHGEETPAGWLGKPWALQQGSARARGELLLFIDADVIYEPDAIAAAVAHLEERDLPMITLLPRFEMHGFWEHIAMPNLAVFAFTMIPLWLVNHSRIPFLGIGAGTGNLMRRDDYVTVGGHEALKAAVVDDVALGSLFRRSGFRTEVVLADDFVSVRMYHGLGEIVRGFTKNMFAVLNRNYAIALFFLVLTGIFHLLPYVLALSGDWVAITTILIIGVSRSILFIALRCSRLDNAMLGHPLMTCVWSWILLRSLWLTGVRRRLEWRGRRYDASRTRFGAD
ncbi:MAG TPA: glycosyltransferase [Thermoanaerobaculia bacterium]|nr:glycosyltransferase [Thermoanaerobaculia bacterium]